MSNAPRLRPVRSAVSQAIRPATIQTPILDWHYKTGLRDYASGSPFSFGRAGQAVQTLSDGSQILTGNNWARNEAKGLLLEGSATNKVTCAKSNPQDLTNISKSGDAAAVLSVVNDAAELAAAGLSTFGPNVYKLDNSTGTAVAYALAGGVTGNTNPHQLSVFARVTGAAGANTLIQPVAPYTGVPATPGQPYTRLQVAGILDSITQIRIRAGAGQVVYFILPQLEEGPVCTSPIPGGTGAITRASEGADTSGNGLSVPLSQAMIDSLVGELLDGTSAWTHVSGTGPAYSGGNRILTYSGALTSSDYHALNATLAIGKQVEVRYTISGYAAGSVALGFGSAAGATRTSNGTYTERGTLTGNTNFYVNSTGFTGVVEILSIRRVLDSGQTNPGEGTVLCGVFIPYSTTVIPASTWIGIVTPDNISDETLLFIGNSSGDLTIYCGEHTPGGYARLTIGASGLLPGIYVLIAQYSARTAQMRVGLYNPATDILTWGNWAAYRGFFPITPTGGQRMRWFYGGGAFPIYARALRCLPGITSDFETIYHAKELSL